MAIEDKTIINNKTSEYLKTISTKSGLKKSLDYEGVSLWWFFEFELYYLMNNHIKKNEGSNSVFKKDMPFKCLNYYLISVAIIRHLLGKIICENKRSEPGNKYKILAVSYTSYWKNYPTPQKDSRRVCGDTMLGDIITALKSKNFNVVTLDTETTYFIDFKTMIEKRIQEKELWRPVETYLTFDIIRNVFKAAKKYKEKWHNLKNNEEFIESLNMDCGGFNLSELLTDYFEKLFKYRTFRPILYIELMKRAIEIEKPDLLLITCGYCALGRAAVIAGKLKDVPTLEIQHGVINAYHPGYMYVEDEISPEGGVKSPYCPLPDKTAVYGNYHKELLTKVSTYPENSVVVTGQPRYDFLCHADKIYSKERFLSKYNINQNNRIILWTTQCHVISDDENVRNFETVFRTMQNLKDLSLVIKQHPNEGRSYTKMIRDYLNKYKVGAVITPKSSDTYEQLFACDLMITRHSTTAMEAVALNKPVIILNLSGEPDTVEYVKEGVALGVYDEKDLEATIKKLLKDDSELVKNRKKYIEKYLYKIDGMATERVVNLIEETINDRAKRDGK